MAAKNKQGLPHRLVACTSQFSKEMPTEITGLMLKILCPNHHGIKPEPEILWLDELPPSDFVLIGKSDVPDEHSQLKCDSFGGWENFRYSALTQWRWQNDRDALLAEEGEQEKKETERYQQTLEEIESERRTMTLQKLSNYRFFSDWDDYPARKFIAASRKLMKSLVNELIEIGDNATNKRKMAAFKTCVEAFNALYAKHDEIGDTAIREDIIEQISLFEYATRCNNLEKRVDEWRDW